MDNFFHEQGSRKQQQTRSFSAGLSSLASIIKWLAGLITLTEEEQEKAGIYLDRLGNE